MNITELEERLDQRLQRPRVTAFAAARAAAGAWSEAVWSLAGSAGPLALAADEIEHAFAIASRPVFIFGVHRSGTTLTRDLLDHHPALSVLPAEGTMFTNFEWHLSRLKPDGWMRYLGCEWLRRLANPINQQPYWLLGRSSEEDSPYVGFARALMAWWPLVEARIGARITAWPLVAIALAYAHCTAGFGAASPLLRWVEKTPANEHFLPRLMTEFPEAKLIHVVRHPFAVYASHRRAAQDSARALGDESRILHQMHRSYRVAAARSLEPASDSYLLVRYEDLLADTAASVQRMATFLGIPMLRVMMRPTANGLPTPSNSSFDVDAAAGRLNRRRAGDPAALLTRRDRERVTAMVGDTAGALGYQLAALPAARKKFLQMRTQAERLADRARSRLDRVLPLRSPRIS